MVGAGSWALRRDGARSTTAPTLTPIVQTARLDLRPFSVLRGSERTTEPDPVVLPRGRVNAILLLPVGAEPGEYEVRLLDKSLTVRASAVGTAAIRNYMTTLEVTIDSTDFSPGGYQLGVRRTAGEWQLFPVQLQ